MINIADYTIASEMADTSRIVFHVLSEQWICHWQYRGESSHPVSKQLSIWTVISTIISCCRYIDEKDSKWVDYICFRHAG